MALLREHLFDKRAPADPLFRWRGADVSRLEALSDGVFAVTLTLLIVSVSVPSTFYELWLAVRDLPVFLVCFVALMMAWRYHYLFFRRYGLEDFLTTVLNGAFLFLILFYAYPLKFLATFLWRLVIGESAEPMFELPAGVEAASFLSVIEQRMGMMLFYGLGVALVFGVLLLMTCRALALDEKLQLDGLERYLTVSSIRSHGITVGVALLSLGLLFWTRNPGWSGVTYFLMGPLHGFHGWWSATRAERIRDQLTAA